MKMADLDHLETTLWNTAIDEIFLTFMPTLTGVLT